MRMTMNDAEKLEDSLRAESFIELIRTVGLDTAMDMYHDEILQVEKAAENDFFFFYNKLSSSDQEKVDFDAGLKKFNDKAKDDFKKALEGIVISIFAAVSPIPIPSEDIVKVVISAYTRITLKSKR
jgi:hypothetical protein